MRFFSMDLHISVIADFKSVCPEIEVIDWCLSGHAWVMKRPQDCPEYINPKTWTCFSPLMIEQFQQKYDTFLRSFDGFIVGHVTCFAMIYEKYNKPIVMINSCRYDLPFCWSKDWGMRLKLHECLLRLNSKGLLKAVSNNRADQLYTKLGSGIETTYIPSLCLYTKATYTPTKSTFLSYSGSFQENPLITPKSSLPERYEWSDITSFRGIVHYPYEASLMSVFEQFTAGCPLFFPSKTLWKSYPQIQSISSYWGDQLPSELSSMADKAVWIELADMYEVFQSPNTHYYDSYEHLLSILTNFTYVDDKEFRAAHIESVKAKWKALLA